MGDIKLFRIANNTVQELVSEAYAIEKSLQTLIEDHIDAFLGIRFLASEYSTGAKHRGRIDTLGLDENGYPVIIEYKRASNENVINQGLYYLDWLLDHKAEFQLLVQEQLGHEAAKAIEWDNPRLLCIAGDFNKFDTFAVEQINRNIELLKYKRFGDDLVMLELINAVQSNVSPTNKSDGLSNTKTYTTAKEFLVKASQELTDLYESLCAFLLNLGEDVQMKELKYYWAFKRLKNFACVEVRPQSNVVLVYTKADLKSIDLEEGLTRDVTNIGHFGTGNLEISLRSISDLSKAEPLLIQSYEKN